MTLELREPALALVDSYRGLVREFLVHGEPLIPWVLTFPAEDPAALIGRFEACARGEDIPDGFVAHSTYWLVRDGAEVVGVSNLRHALTAKLRVEGGHIGYGVRPSARRRGVATELLRQTLVRARAMGIPRALVTCARTNEASVRTILANGGRFDSEEFIADRGEVVQRYWIASGPVAGDHVGLEEEGRE